MKGGIIGSLLVVAVLGSACDAAEGVRVQELPPLERSSPEVRAGLPLVEGEWRFAGWELAPGDSALLDEELPGFGQIQIELQRLDSIAGVYRVPGAQVPVVGEVRRDGVVALVVQAGEGGRFLAGRVRNDTLWVSTTTLLEQGSWPSDARAAFVRTPVTATFARLEGQPTVLPGDTVPPVLAGPVESPTDAEPADETGEAASPRPSQPVTGAPAEAAATAPRARPERPRAAPPAAAPAERAPAEPPAPAEPAEEPPRRGPRLLGEPIEPDSVPG